MKFDDMKMKKDSIVDDAEKNRQERLHEIVEHDRMIATEIIDLFCELSIVGKRSVLCTCIEGVAAGLGVTPDEFADEIKQTIKVVHGNGRQAEDS